MSRGPDAHTHPIDVTRVVFVAKNANKVQLLDSNQCYKLKIIIHKSILITFFTIFAKLKNQVLLTIIICTRV